MVSCKEYVAIKKEELKEKIKTFARPPKLCVIQVGDNPASNSYIKGKRKDAEEVGIEFVHIKLPEEVEQGQLEHQVQLQSCINDGVIVQLPLPKHIDVERITKLIPANKDVDGFRSDSCFKPCTPKGIIDWLEYNEYEFEGKTACVIGRSNILGKPLAEMLTDCNATVILCHSKTTKKQLDKLISDSDIVFTCIDKIEHFTYEDFYSWQDIVDVGLGRGKDGKLHGNIEEKSLDKIREKNYGHIIISGKGNTGLTTRLSLVENTVEAYELNMEE